MNRHPKRRRKASSRTDFRYIPNCNHIYGQVNYTDL